MKSEHICPWCRRDMITPQTAERHIRLQHEMLQGKTRWYRRGKCPECGKTAERLLYLTKSEYQEWCKEPVRHKRCEV